MSLATFAANVPVIFVTVRGSRFENDSVAKLVASLAASDIVNGIAAACCAGVAWSLQPGDHVPAWLLRIINSGMYTFGVCSIWHLAAVSVVKCTVIIRPLTHFTIFTDRVLRAIICIIWTFSMVVGGIINVGVVEAHFRWSDMVVYVIRQENESFAGAFAALNVVVATLIIMIAYAKVFLVVRRQVRSMSTAVPGLDGSTMIFGSSVRSAKNLFVICAVYWLSYMPVTVRLALRTRGVMLPDAVEFLFSWVYISLAALNGILYIALHSSVRSELRRYLPRCRRPTIAPASTQPVDDGTRPNLGATSPATAGAPADVLTSSSQRAAKRLETAVV